MQRNGPVTAWRHWDRRLMAISSNQLSLCTVVVFRTFSVLKVSAVFNINFSGNPAMPSAGLASTASTGERPGLDIRLEGVVKRHLL